MPLNDPPSGIAPINEPTLVPEAESIITQTAVVSTLPAQTSGLSTIKLDGSDLGYLGYGCTIAYQRDYGLRGQAVAGVSGSLVDFARIHGGWCRKVVSVVATRVGSKPVLPAPQSYSPNDVLLSDLIVPFSPGKFTDGTPIYGVVCQFVFGLQKMPTATDQLDMGSTPWDVNPPSVNTLNPADFVTNLIGPAQPVGGMPTTGITY